MIVQALSFFARPLIVVYAALLVALNVVVALPGNPHYSSGLWGVIGSIVIQALLVWRLWRGSAIAWVLGFLAALLTVVSLVLLVGPPFNATLVFFIVLLLAQTGILVALAIEWQRAASPAVSH